MKRSEVFAPAKINLTLHVTGQRADGYHLLDSLVAFADIGDRVRMTAGPMLSIEVSGPFARGVPTDQSNLVWKAAELAGWTGWIELEKNLPHGAGIGGGSADAAAVLRAVDYDGDATALGADVPVCRLARAARMTGIGDAVRTLPGLPPLYAVLANPGVHVSTPHVFGALTAKNNAPMPVLPDRPSAMELIRWLGAQRNDLEQPAVQAQPVIGDALNALSERARDGFVRMSGSGATCFALCATRDEAASIAEDLTRAHPDWWVCDCALS